MLTGDSIELFLDRDSIPWGDAWRTRIDDSLGSVAFFVPVITPRYFQSNECRRELQIFADKAREAGTPQLIMPIYYVPIQNLEHRKQSDDLVRLVFDYQWSDWRDLRLCDPTSESYRRAVNSLAQSLVEANSLTDALTSTALVTYQESSDDDSDDSMDGFIDVAANAEETIPLWAETIEKIGEQIVLVGELMTAANEEVNSTSNHASGFAARRRLARKLAVKLEEPSRQILQLSNDASAHLRKIDAGYQAILQKIPSELKENPDFIDEIRPFIKTIEALEESVSGASEGIESMIRPSKSLASLSRDLQPALRRISEGLTMFLESRQVIANWRDLVSNLDLPI